MPQDWKNIDLDSHEIDSSLIDDFTFEDLMLLINCNLPVINKETVRAEFMKLLESKVDETKDIFESNLDNIVKYAIKERKQK